LLAHYLLSLTDREGDARSLAPSAGTPASTSRAQ
jgi:hypothetical protein